MKAKLALVSIVPTFVTFYWFAVSARLVDMILLTTVPTSGGDFCFVRHLLCVSSVPLRTIATGAFPRVVPISRLRAEREGILGLPLIMMISTVSNSHKKPSHHI